MKSSLKIPADWTFQSAEVAKHFNDHVRQQLPWYDMATDAVAHLGRQFIPEGGRVYDIGASTGNIGNALRDTLSKRRAIFTAIEESKEMAKRYEGPPKLVVANALDYDYKPFDFAVAFLALMFIPVSLRYLYLRLLQNATLPGGALVIVDKVETPPGYVGTALSRLTIRQKLAGGAQPAAIIEKELSLAGYQRPLNPSLLPKHARRFFQVGEFVGWIIPGAEN
jgi:tRNA (cmo5U34)-methyltransferase